MRPTILISSDDATFLDFLDYLLQVEGFRTLIANDAAQAARIAAEESPRLALVDCRQGPEPGVEFCTGLRRARLAVVQAGTAHEGGRRRSGDGNAPAVIAIADGDDRAAAVRLREAGVDECMAGPPLPAELARRLRSHLERSADAAPNRLAHGGIELHLSACEVRRDGQRVELGATEFRLLRQFMERPGKVFTRAELIERAWANKVAPDSRTVDVHVGRLRRALNGGSKSDPIRTVRSVGYALKEGEDGGGSQ